MLYSSIKKIFIQLFIALIFCGITQSVEARIAVLKVKSCPNYFIFKHKNHYDKKFRQFINTFNATELDYSIIKESSIPIDNKAYEVIVVPYLHNYSNYMFNRIKKYSDNGGKIVLIPSDDNDDLQKINKVSNILGVKLYKIKELDFNEQVDFVNNKMQGSIPKDSAVAVAESNATPLAFLGKQEENIQAVSLNPKGSFISWQWGIDGSKQFNIDSMHLIMKNLYPESTVKIYNKKNKQIYLKDLALIQEYNGIIEKFITSGTNKKKKKELQELQGQLALSKEQLIEANDKFNKQIYEDAVKNITLAKQHVLNAYEQTLPFNPVEARALWLDRGTIVAINTQKEMAALFESIKASGINIVYFETVNAGYSIHSSSITEQNPLAKGKKLLKWATREAHKRDIELHAWLWVYAVGNKRHNQIVNKEFNFEGPVLNKHQDWSLLGLEGNLCPKGQHEYWIDPSNEDAKEYLLDLIKEIAFKYDVDGIQLDYIRYPFQTKSNLMGLNINSRQLFEQETGCMLDDLSREKLKIFNLWKQDKINSFVESVNQEIKKRKRNFIISAAVFGGSNYRRLNTIQQDWVEWSDNAWVDVLNPMIYSKTKENFIYSTSVFNKKVGGKVFVYPGIALKHLDDFSLVDQVITVNNLGLNGNTIFAMAHLDKEKAKILASGPYKSTKSYNPTNNPLKAAIILTKEIIKSLRKLKLESPVNKDIDSLLKYSYSLNSHISGSSIKSLDMALVTINQLYEKIEILKKDNNDDYIFIKSRLQRIEKLVEFVVHRKKLQKNKK